MERLDGPPRGAEATLALTAGSFWVLSSELSLRLPLSCLAHHYHSVRAACPSGEKPRRRVNPFADDSLNLAVGAEFSTPATL